MSNYRVKADTGPWKAGDIITDADLNANPRFGGSARLRDKLGSIEDTDAEPLQPGKAPELPANTKPAVVTEVGRAGTVAPNVASRRAGGKS